MTVIDSDADEIFPTDVTMRPTLSYVNLINTAGIVDTEGESSEPLFRLTITRFTKLNSTSIGTSNSHVLRSSSLDLPSPSCCVDENDIR